MGRLVGLGLGGSCVAAEEQAAVSASPSVTNMAPALRNPVMGKITNILSRLPQGTQLYYPLLPAWIPSSMGSFKIPEHTGEIGVLARGDTPAQAFSQAARGMFSFMVALDAVEEREVRHVEIEGRDLEALLVAWLNELIYLFDVEGMVFKRFQIEEMDDTRIKALCHGEKLDIVRHKFSIEPKAATYHMIEVREASDRSGWQARVILDI